MSKILQTSKRTIEYEDNYENEKDVVPSTFTMKMEMDTLKRN